MLTPQEVSQRVFSKASFGGYHMGQVDEFLDVLTVDYSALYKENTLLKSKLKVLAEKLEEYRATEDAMRMTLLSAQKMADSIISDAEAKRDEMLKTASTEADTRLATYQQDIENEGARLAAAQAETSAYVAKVKELCQHVLTFLEGLKDFVVAAPQPDLVKATAEEIEDNIKNAFADTIAVTLPHSQAEAAEAPAVPEEAPADTAGSVEDAAVPSEDDEPTMQFDLAASLDDDELFKTKTRINFDDLQFGKDYELS